MKVLPKVERVKTFPLERVAAVPASRTSAGLWMTAEAYEAQAFPHVNRGVLVQPQDTFERAADSSRPRSSGLREGRAPARRACPTRRSARARRSHPAMRTAARRTRRTSVSRASPSDGDGPSEPEPPGLIRSVGEPSAFAGAPS